MVSVQNGDKKALAESYAENENQSDVESLVFKYIAENKFNELKSLYAQHKIKADIYDSDGMTPLQHACYKGNKDIVELLLEHGADVNNTHHLHQYTALHFAALVGNPDLCLTLMTAGAKSHLTNTVGRTAAQMAAFVGNHNCVVVINNYVPKTDIDYYTSPKGVDSKPKLSPSLSTPLYNYIMQVNIHPVRLAVKMPKILLKEYSQVKKVLELLSEREIKKGSESNEVLSFKFHYLDFILSEIHKSISSEKQTDPIEIFAKKILKSPRGEEYLDLLLRDCVREFPYRECTLFQQMVKSLARKQDSPPALNVILSVINGQIRFTSDDTPCVTCAEPQAYKKCSKCKAVQYCDRECQRLHWFIHKKECARSPTSNLPATKPDEKPNKKIDTHHLAEELQNLGVN